MSLSQTVVVGRLTKDPEVREVTVGGQPTSVANFSVACDRDYGEGTDFYDVVVWRKQAENVGKYLKKGREVLALGRMQKRTYTAKTPEGAEYPRDVWELHADKVQFLGSAKDQGGNQGGGGGYQRQSTPQPQHQEPAYDPYAGGAPF